MQREKSEIVQAAEIIAKALDRVADAISTPAAAYRTEEGGKVDCLTEAMIYLGKSVRRVGEDIANQM